MKHNIYAEVRSNFYDEEDKCIVIDAWKTSNPDEEGLAVAKIYDNGNVDYLYPDSRYDKIVQEEIKSVVANLKQ